MQNALPLDEGNIAKIVAIQIKQVEDKQGHRRTAREMSDGIRIGNRDARLNEAETGNSVLIQHGDFAVKHGLVSRESGGR